MVQRRRAADVVLEQHRQFGLKRGVLAGFVVFGRQFIERVDKRFGHIAPAELAEAAGGIRNLRGYLHCLVINVDSQL